MCVCPNQCVSLSHSASASYKRFRPRQQHGSAGREIAFHFRIGYLLCLWICRQWERKLISHCYRRQYKRQTVITWCLEKVKEAKVEEVDQQEEVSGENWGVGVLKTLLRLWVKMILFLIILLLHRCCCTGKSVLCVCVSVCDVAKGARSRAKVSKPTIIRTFLMWSPSAHESIISMTSCNTVFSACS